MPVDYHAKLLTAVADAKSHVRAYAGQVQTVTGTAEADRGYVRTYHRPSDTYTDIPLHSEGNVWERAS